MSDKLTPLQALKKIQYYCAYQERCHQEVKEKLYGYGLYKNEVEEIIVQLITDNYLNEERFAKSFAGGKFRIKKWGRIKITTELKRRQISPYNIKEAMKEIDTEDYYSCLQELVYKKWQQLNRERKAVKRIKIIQMFLAKGFEYELIKEALCKIEKEHD